MKIKLLAAAASAAMLTVCLGGCAQQATVAPAPESEPEAVEADATEERQDLVIDESGYYIDEFGSGHYAVIISNPNSSWAAEAISLDVTSKDAAGNIVGTTQSGTTLLFPSGKTAICGRTFDAVAPETLEFSVSVRSTGWTEMSEPTQDEFNSVFHVDGLNEVAGSYGQTSFTGELVNETEGTFSLPSVHVVMRDESGAVVGGCFGYVGSSSEIAGGQTVAFSIDESDVPAHATIEAYVDCGYPQSA